MTVLLGRQAAGATPDFNTAAATAAWRFDAVASGQLALIWAQTQVANPTGVVTLGIYADDGSGNFPGARLGGPAVAANANGAGAFFAQLAAPVAIVAATRYWLAWRNSLENFDFTGTAGVLGDYRESASDFLDPWPGGSGAGDIGAILWGETAAGQVLLRSLRARERPHLLGLGLTACIRGSML